MTGYETVRQQIDAAIKAGVEAHNDGSITFTPPFTKDEADYRQHDDGDFDPNHDRCGECVHYIEGGGCHLVRGQINETDYCAEFYADYGAFGHEHEGYVEVNAELVGDAFAFDSDDVADFVDEIEERLEQRVRAVENPPPHPQFAPGDRLGFAVFDPDTSGFVRSGFAGQVVFEDPDDARDLAKPGMFVVRLEMEELA